MKKIYLLMSLLTAFVFFSCEKENFDDVNPPFAGKNPELINRTGQVNGVTYTLKDVAVNPGVVSLNTENSALVNVSGDVYEVEILSADIAGNLAVGNTILLKTEDETYLKKIEGITVSGNVYELVTSEAGLSDLFEGGSMNLSADLLQAGRTLRSEGIDKGYAFDIFNQIKEYNADGFKMNPNTSVKFLFNVKIGFGGKKVKTPNEVVVTYEFQTASNPYMMFTKAVNRKYAVDFAELVPEELIGLLTTFETTVDLPLGSLGTIPVKVGVSDIKFPVSVSANLSKEADLSYSANGSFKVGYAYYKGIAGKTSHPIYENTMEVSDNFDLKLNGEVLSDANIIITPKITIVESNLLNIAGDIIFGVKTESSGGVDALTQQYVAGSKGEFHSEWVLNVSSLGILLFKTEIFKETKELWNVGSFDKTFTIQGVSVAKPSKTICALRSYSFDITANYRYPILGKKITDEIEVTYDVYDDTRKLLKGGEKAIVSPYNVTGDSFTFSLCIPFKVDVWAATSGFVKKMAYIKNIKITDANGNVADGVANMSEIPLGSPYNNSFWK